MEHLLLVMEQPVVACLNPLRLGLRRHFQETVSKTQQLKLTVLVKHQYNQYFQVHSACIHPPGA